MNNDRIKIANLIFDNLVKNHTNLKKQFNVYRNDIGFFYLDDLLPNDLALEIFENFPKIEQTVLKKNIREHKHTAYQMNKYSPLLEEVIYAFQEKKVVDIISEICQLQEIFPDKKLYAGGLSLMKKDNFLNPHLDNSHDKDRNLWRVLNLLYYVSPDWKKENGGNLELWQHGIQQQPTTIESKFNRLVVMATHQNSWHSVSKVNVDAIRCCVSNYYFSKLPFFPTDEFHITTFRALPQEKIKDFILQMDNGMRSFLRKLFKKGVRENPHQYKQE